MIHAYWIFMGALAVSLGWGQPAAQADELISVDARAGAFLAVVVDQTDTRQIFAATARTLYASSDGGQSWRPLFEPPLSASVTSLALLEPGPTVLLGTTEGLFASFDAGARWKRVHRGRAAGSAVCTALATHPSRPDLLALGTRDGLYLSTDQGHRWKTLGVPQAARDVIHLAFQPADGGRLYLVSAGGLFVGDVEHGWWEQRASGSLFAEEQAEVEEPDEHDEAEEDSGFLHRLSGIVADPSQPSVLYLAGARGVARSEDEGVTWQPLPRLGMTIGVSRLLLQRRSPLVAYAATGQGVARHRAGAPAWEWLGQGLAVSPARDLAAAGDVLWAATDQGLLRFEVGPEVFPEPAPPTAQELLSNFHYEPTIAQIQEAAIRYAEVHPDKIRRWRRQAALQALLPSVDIGVDHNRSLDTSIDEGSFPNFQVLNTKDKDNNLDVSIGWDLGNLIWNDDQTSIDVRSKLMVQLRDDIVDEVTRTYFERRRLQVALLTSPPVDQPKLLDQELRLQELTALLDGLTGGYFSAHAGLNAQP
jgi:hypothetical protein